MMSTFADFEGALILEHPRECIAAAKARSGYVGRMPALAANQIGRPRVGLGTASLDDPERCQ